MSQQENQKPTNPVVEVEDLTVEESAQREVKGGLRIWGRLNPCYHNFLQLSRIVSGESKYPRGRG